MSFEVDTLAPQSLVLGATAMLGIGAAADATRRAVDNSKNPGSGGSNGDAIGEGLVGTGLIGGTIAAGWHAYSKAGATHLWEPKK